MRRPRAAHRGCARGRRQGLSRSRMAARRVAVTGAGVVSPLGKSLAEFHAALAEGRSGIRRLPESLAQGSGVQVGALVDWNPAPLFNEAEAVNIDRVSQFALAAAAQALAASRLDLSTADRDRLGVYWGTGMGGAHTLEGAYKNVYGGGEWRVRPPTGGVTMKHAARSNGAVRHGLRGPFAHFSTACSSSALAPRAGMRPTMAGRPDAGAPR